MSNSDSFIDEVTEEVRRDRLFGLMRRYGWIAVTLIVVLVGGAAYLEWQKARETARAQAFGDAVMAALREPDATARREALDSLGSDSAQRAVAALLAAGEVADAAERTSAAAALDAVAADDSLPQVYRDLAVLKSVMVQGEAIAPADRIARLEPLTIPGAPFRLLALEQTALARVAAGETGQAIAQAQDILGQDGVTPDLRSRLQQLIVALGGSVEQA